jgi:hypothetical protein
MSTLPNPFSASAKQLLDIGFLDTFAWIAILATILCVISVTSRSPSSLWDASLTTTDAPSTARYWAIALQSPRSRPSRVATLS